MMYPYYVHVSACTHTHMYLWERFYCSYCYCLGHGFISLESVQTPGYYIGVTDAGDCKSQLNAGISDDEKFVVIPVDKWMTDFNVCKHQSYGEHMQRTNYIIYLHITSYIHKGTFFLNVLYVYCHSDHYCYPSYCIFNIYWYLHSV